LLSIDNFNGVILIVIVLIPIKSMVRIIETSANVDSIRTHNWYGR